MSICFSVWVCVSEWKEEEKESTQKLAGRGGNLEEKKIPERAKKRITEKEETKRKAKKDRRRKIK